MSPLDFFGGEKMKAALDAIENKLSTSAELKVGFLESARYPDGTPIAYIAAINEFGGSWTMPEREATIYRAESKKGKLLRKGRFVKRRKSNFATAVTVGSYVHTQPPRPFFRNMIAANKTKWGAQIAKLLKATDYDPQQTLDQMGFEIEGQLQTSIKKLTSPPLAASTVKAKGFSKPLIGGSRDSGGGGLMWQSTGHEVTTGE